jgi:hypothetical protein
MNYEWREAPFVIRKNLIFTYTILIILFVIGANGVSFSTTP